MTTVGPVTTRIPPNRMATGQTRPPILSGGDCAQYPAYRYAEDDEAPDPVARMAQFAKVEAQAPFEQDQCNANRHHRLEQFAKGVLGVD